MPEQNRKISIIEKGKNNLLKENFSFVCFAIALLIIIIYLASAIINSIKHNMLWIEIVELVENTFLCSLLIIILISIKRKKLKIVESLIGELLAIYLVATTVYFCKSIDFLHMAYSTGGDYIVTADYVLLIIEFILMLSIIFIFFDHLFEKGKEEHINDKKIPIRILAFLDSIALIVYIIAILSYGGIEYIEVFLEEFLYVFFGTAISYAILSIEMRKAFLKEEYNYLF